MVDSASLQAGLDKISAVKRRLDRLATYAELSADVDTRAEASQMRRQLAEDLGNKLDEATSFLKPEVSALGRQKIEAFLAERPVWPIIAIFWRPFCGKPSIRWARRPKMSWPPPRRRWPSRKAFTACCPMPTSPGRPSRFAARK